MLLSKQTSGLILIDLFTGPFLYLQRESVLFHSLPYFYNNPEWKNQTLTLEGRSSFLFFFLPFCFCLLVLLLVEADMRFFFFDAICNLTASKSYKLVLKKCLDVMDKALLLSLWSHDNIFLINNFNECRERNNTKFTTPL